MADFVSLDNGDAAELERLGLIRFVGQDEHAFGFELTDAGRRYASLLWKMQQSNQTEPLERLRETCAQIADRHSATNLCPKMIRSIDVREYDAAAHAAAYPGF
jgi:hypothetical protein